MSKCISIRQPWARAIVHLGKRLENRDWQGCAYRGPVLLHASKGVGTRADFDEDVDALLDIVRPEPGADRLALLSPIAKMHVALRGRHHGEGIWLPAPLLPRGGVIGRARIDGVIRDERDFAAYAANVPGGEEQRRWWAGGFALVLADVEPLPFVPWKGELGLFEVDEAALARIAEGATR